MKVFIGGSIGIKSLDNTVTNELDKYMRSEYEILIGDAHGVDRLVQKHLFANTYKNVVIYASGGNVRNNIGGWQVEKIEVPSGITGKEFYAYKDTAMSADCDCGFMIWNGKSKGTLANIRRLSDMGKSVQVYLPEKEHMKTVCNYRDYIKLLGAKEIAKILTHNTPIEEIVSYCDTEQDFERIVSEFMKLHDEKKQ